MACEKLPIKVRSVAPFAAALPRLLASTEVSEDEPLAGVASLTSAKIRTDDGGEGEADDGEVEAGGRRPGLCFNCSIFLLGSGKNPRCTRCLWTLEVSRGRAKGEGVKKAKLAIHANVTR